jgi:hypothetical protein
MTHFSKSWTKQDEKEYLKEYYQKNKETIKANSHKNWYGVNHLKNIKRSTEYNRIHADRKNAINRKCYNKRRLKVLTHYSNGTVSCKVCGIKDIRVLSIDHINGNGKAHFRQIGHNRIYDWLIKNNFPEGYQVLCMNHQFIKRHVNNECKRRIFDIIDCENNE